MHSVRRLRSDVRMTKAMYDACRGINGDDMQHSYWNGMCMQRAIYDACLFTFKDSAFLVPRWNVPVPEHRQWPHNEWRNQIRLCKSNSPPNEMRDSIKNAVFFGYTVTLYVDVLCRIKKKLLGQVRGLALGVVCRLP